MLFLTIASLAACAHFGCSSATSSPPNHTLNTGTYVNMVTDAIERVWKESAAVEKNRTMGNVAIPGLVLTGPTILDRGTLGVVAVPSLSYNSENGSVEMKVLAGLNFRKVKYTYIRERGVSGDFVVVNGYRQYKMFFKTDYDCAALTLVFMILVEEDPIAVEAHGPSAAHAIKLSETVNHWLTLESRASAYNSINDSMAQIQHYAQSGCRASIKQPDPSYRTCQVILVEYLWKRVRKDLEPPDLSIPAREFSLYYEDALVSAIKTYCS